MLAKEIKSHVKNFYEIFLREYDKRMFILVGGAAAVLLGAEEETNDIDIMVIRKKEFHKLQEKMGVKECPISYNWNGVKYDLGLPHEFVYTRPYNTKKIVKINDTEIFVRPPSLLFKDYSIIVEKFQNSVKKIEDPPSTLEKIPDYMKYKRRMERLEQILY